MRFVATSLVIALGATGCAKDDPFADDGGDDGSGSSSAGDAADDMADSATSPTAPEGDATAADDETFEGVSSAARVYPYSTTITVQRLGSTSPGSIVCRAAPGGSTWSM